MIRKNIVSLTLVLMLLIGSLTVLGAFTAAGESPLPPAITVYVSPSGSTYTSIQDAVDDVWTGCTVIVGDGTYNEQVVVDKQLTLKGNSTEDVIIDANSNVYTIDCSDDYIVISTLTVQNGAGTNGYSGIQFTNCDNAHIHNVNVVDCWFGIYIAGGQNNLVNLTTVDNCRNGLWYDASDYGLVKNCTISSSNFHSLYVDWADYIQINDTLVDGGLVSGFIFDNANFATVLRCEALHNSMNLLQNSDDGVWMDNIIDDANNQGMRLTSCLNWDISRNVFSNNKLEAIRILTPEDHEIYDNSFIHNNPGGKQVSNDASNTEFYKGTQGNYWSDYSFHYTSATVTGNIYDTPYQPEGGTTKTDMYPEFRDERLSYSAHNPIRIDSDADFTLANGVTGGDGSASAPFLINNWDINGTGYGYGIYIGNTTLNFTIENCTVHHVDGVSAPYHYEDGIHLYTLVNGTVHNTSVTYNDNYGVRTDWSDSLTFSDNLLLRNWRSGIYANNGMGFLVQGNNFTLNNQQASSSWGGMYVSLITDSEITDNYYSHNPYYGLVISVSDRLWFHHNEVVYNCGGEAGLYMEGSDNILIENNNISNSTGDGIDMYQSNDCIIINNTLNDNNRAGGSGGLRIYDCDRLKVINNTIDYNNNYGVYHYNCQDTYFDNNQIHNNDYISFRTQNCDGLFVNDTSIIGSDTGLMVDSGADIFFTNSTFSSITDFDIDASADTYLINCTLVNDNVVTDPLANVYFQWYHEIYYHDNVGAVAGVDCGVYGNDSVHQFSSISDQNGMVYWANITEYYFNDDGKYYLNQLTNVSGTMAGYDDSWTLLNASDSNYHIEVEMKDTTQPNTTYIEAVPNQYVNMANPTNVQATFIEANPVHYGIIYTLYHHSDLDYDYYQRIVDFEQDSLVAPLVVDHASNDRVFYNQTWYGEAEKGGYITDGSKRQYSEVWGYTSPEGEILGVDVLMKNTTQTTYVKAELEFNGTDGSLLGMTVDGESFMSRDQLDTATMVKLDWEMFIFDATTGGIQGTTPYESTVAYNAMNVSLDIDTKVPSGNYNIVAYMGDRGGNMWGDYVPISVDNSGPDMLNIDLSPNPYNGIYKGELNLTVTTSSADVKDCAFFYSDDLVDWEFFYLDDTPADGFWYAWDSTLDEDWSGYLRAELNDTWYNLNVTAALPVTVDNTKPEMHFGEPPQLYFKGGEHGLVVEDYSNDAKWCNFYYIPEGQGMMAIGNDTDLSDGVLIYFNASLFPEGNGTVFATVGDRVNNTNTTGHKIIIDMTAPAISNLMPEVGSWLGLGTQTITVDVFEKNIDYVSFYISEDNMTWILKKKDMNATDGFGFDLEIDSSALTRALGDLYVKIVAMDLAGNNKTMVEMYHYDNDVPIVKFVSPTNGTTIPLTDPITLSFNVSDGISGIANLLVSYAGPMNGTIYSGGVSEALFDLNWTTFGLTEGTFVITALAADAAGNTASDVITLIIGGITDTTAPTIVDSFPKNLTEDVAVDAVVSITFSEPMDSASVSASLDVWENTYKLPSSEYILMWNGSVLTIEFTDDLQYGFPYVVKITTNATDLAGNKLDKPFMLIFETDYGETPDVPKVTITAPVSLAEYSPGAEITISGTSEHLDGQTLTISTTGSTVDTVVQTGGAWSAVITAPDSPSTYEISVKGPNGTTLAKVSIIVRSEVDDDDDDDDDDDTTTSQGVIFAIIAVVLLVVIVGVVVFFVLKKKGDNEEDEEEVEDEELLECKECGAIVDPEDGECQECGEPIPEDDEDDEELDEELDDEELDDEELDDEDEDDFLDEEEELDDEDEDEELEDDDDGWDEDEEEGDEEFEEEEDEEEE